MHGKRPQHVSDTFKLSLSLTMCSLPRASHSCGSNRGAPSGGRCQGGRLLRCRTWLCAQRNRLARAHTRRKYNRVMCTRKTQTQSLMHGETHLSWCCSAIRPMSWTSAIAWILAEQVEHAFTWRKQETKKDDSYIYNIYIYIYVNTDP